MIFIGVADLVMSSPEALRGRFNGLMGCQDALIVQWDAMRCSSVATKSMRADSGGFWRVEGNGNPVIH